MLAHAQAASAERVPPAARADEADRALRLERECPDTAVASRFGGEAMVQSFRVHLPGGGAGRCWMPTAVALATPGFSRQWVAGYLAARISLLGHDHVAAELGAPGGLRLAA